MQSWREAFNRFQILWPEVSVVTEVATATDPVGVGKGNGEIPGGDARKDIFAVVSQPRDAAEAAAATDVIARLLNGYDHLLGKMFLEGAELSSGEWQRIALARAFHRFTLILILDEPTSAMDPWAAADWLDRFCSLASGLTTILITHRFTTAMRANFIHVVSVGDIGDSGTHAKLLASNGLYAQSRHQQIQPAATPARFMLLSV